MNEYNIEITRITKHKIKVNGANKKQAIANAKMFANEIETGSNKAYSAMTQSQERFKFIEEVVTGGNK
ncbi:MAG: hypothetical protein PHC62_03940 [Candidatus Izemoplasmatales bacterium]|nr:hypothetical protein [Candidatus Izemoplasmatales bacterium]